MSDFEADLARAAADLGADITTPLDRPDPRTHRLGKVIAVAAGPPPTVTIEGGSKPMRYVDLGSGVTIAVNDRVIWVDQGTDPFVVGKLKA